MLKRQAEEIISGLSAPQLNRLKMYRGNLSTDKDPHHFDKDMYDYLLEVSGKPELVELTRKQMDGIGWNQSKYSSSQIVEQVNRFTSVDVPYFGWNRFFKKAKARLIESMEKANLRSLNYGRNANIRECLPREDTHAGWSFIITGDKQKGAYKEELSQNFDREVKEARVNGSFNKPIIIGNRTQANDPYDEGVFQSVYKDKTRLVSMLDIYVIMAETKFSKPFQNYLQNVDWYAGGKSDSAIHRYVHYARLKSVNWYSIDYSKYDQSIPKWLIHESFDVIRAAFSRDPEFDEELFDIIKNDFIHKVFVSLDELVQASKGVPSGSMFTQIIDSIANKLMIDTYALAKGLKIKFMMIMGDDNIFFTDDEFDNDDLVGYLKRNFGIEMNKDKSSHGTRFKAPEFLSREWRAEGIYRNPQLLFAKLMYPERRRDYSIEGMTPNIIVECYRRTFPLGMTLTSKHEEKNLTLIKKIGGGKWLSGLMRLRLLYNL